MSGDDTLIHVQDNKISCRKGTHPFGELRSKLRLSAQQEGLFNMHGMWAGDWGSVQRNEMKETIHTASASYPWALIEGLIMSDQLARPSPNSP